MYQDDKQAKRRKYLMVAIALVIGCASGYYLYKTSPQQCKPAVLSHPSLTPNDMQQLIYQTDTPNQKNTLDTILPTDPGDAPED